MVRPATLEQAVEEGAGLVLLTHPDEHPGGSGETRHERLVVASLVAQLDQRARGDDGACERRSRAAASSARTKR